MKKKVITLLAGVLLVLACAALSVGQETTTTVTQTPTTVTKTVQNADGSFTVIEYPVGKEVQVLLNPVGITADGTATILRDDAGTRIKVKLNKLPADMATINLYAVDETGAVTSLGPATVSNGSVMFHTTSPISKFMLIASPETKLTTYDPNTKVVFRSAVPAGLAVIPRVVTPVGETVGATTAAEAAPTVTTTAPAVVTTTPAAPTVTTTAPVVVTTTPAAPTVVTTQPTVVATQPTVVATQPTTTATLVATTYTVPMLNIPAFKKGDDTKMKVNFSGPLTGARANIFITPRKDGPTEVKVRFHELKDAPSGKVYHVWAVSPENQFVKLGQVVNAPGRNEAEVKSEITLADFGLMITTEDATGDLTSPHGERVGIVEIVK